MSAMMRMTSTRAPMGMTDADGNRRKARLLPRPPSLQSHLMGEHQLAEMRQGGVVAHFAHKQVGGLAQCDHGLLAQLFDEAGMPVRRVHDLVAHAARQPVHQPVPGPHDQSAAPALLRVCIHVHLPKSGDIDHSVLLVVVEHPEQRREDRELVRAAREVRESARGGGLGPVGAMQAVNGNCERLEVLAVWLGRRKIWRLPVPDKGLGVRTIENEPLVVLHEVRRYHAAHMPRCPPACFVEADVGHILCGQSIKDLWEGLGR
mmetsp:Transcript_92209/g.256931  ORF Transcript_92209/g.256931 Transcript_92209/m.256931 type:complete len:261 (-) Transcript_92209:414-1196(-)